MSDLEVKPSGQAADSAPSFAEWSEVLAGNPSREELEWVIRWSSGRPRMRDEPSMSEVWKRLEKAQVEWDAELLYQLSTSGIKLYGTRSNGIGPYGSDAWRWLAEHPARDLRVLEQCGYASTLGGIKHYPTGDFARAGLQHNPHAEVRAAFIIARMQGQDPPDLGGYGPKTAKVVSSKLPIETYQKRFAFIFKPLEHGSRARLETFLRLLDDGWAGTDEELFEAVGELS